MDIIVSEQEKTSLLYFVPDIKPEIEAWQFAEVKLCDESSSSLGIRQAAVQISQIFKSYLGKLVICNSQELFMLIKVEGKLATHTLSKHIEDALPGHVCEVYVNDLSVDGLKKLEILVKGPKVVPPSVEQLSIGERRRRRMNNLVYVVDDDLFIRSLIEKALLRRAVVKQFNDGADVLKAYAEDAPDMVFLDFHLPVMRGDIILQEIKHLDPESHVVMLSLDSSKDNVLNSIHLSAKGFLSKPFTKEKLLEYYAKCPTVA